MEFLTIFLWIGKRTLYQCSRGVVVVLVSIAEILNKNVSHETFLPKYISNPLHIGNDSGYFLQMRAINISFKGDWKSRLISTKWLPPLPASILADWNLLTYWMMMLTALNKSEDYWSYPGFLMCNTFPFFVYWNRK